jgi:proteasome lid subunit RPN8/RPN11
VAHAQAAAPAECCGLLVGTAARIEAGRRARNLDDRPTRFLIDPRDHFAAIREARASNRRVVGVYHSHPTTPSVPSPSDLAEASYADYVYLIVSLCGAPPDVRLYRLDGAGFREEPLVPV